MVESGRWRNRVVIRILNGYVNRKGEGAVAGDKVVRKELAERRGRGRRRQNRSPKVDTEGASSFCPR